MIRITIELVPYGFEDMKRVIADGVIYNDNTGTVELGNYKTAFRTYGRDNNCYSGEVKNFPRKLDVVQLLEIALQKAKETEDVEDRVKHYLHSERSGQG